MSEYPEIQPSHPMDWINHEMMEKVNFPNAKRIINVMFNNRRKTFVENASEKKYILLAFMDFMQSNNEFRQLIEIVRTHKETENLCDVKVWCRTHTTGTERYPHISVKAETPFGAINLHFYWHLGSETPKFHTMTGSFMVTACPKKTSVESK